MEPLHPMMNEIFHWFMCLLGLLSMYWLYSLTFLLLNISKNLSEITWFASRSKLVCMSSLVGFVLCCLKASHHWKNASSILLGCLGKKQLGSTSPWIVSILVAHMKHLLTCLAEISSIVFSQQTKRITMGSNMVYIHLTPKTCGLEIWVKGVHVANNSLNFLPTCCCVVAKQFLTDFWSAHDPSWCNFAACDLWVPSRNFPTHLTLSYCNEWMKLCKMKWLEKFLSWFQSALMIGCHPFFKACYH